MAQQNSNDSIWQEMAGNDRRASRVGPGAKPNPAATGSRLGGRIAAFAVAIVVTFAAVFYGLNASSVDPKTTPVATTVPDTPLNQTAQNSSSDPAVNPAGMRSNAVPDITTGAAPSNSKEASPPK